MDGRALVVGLVASAAVAQEPEARALFDEGVALYERGKYQQAAERFEASFALRPTPSARYNAARAWEKAGRIPQAIDAWQGWLLLSPSSPQRNEAEAALKALGERLARQGLQALTITSLPVQARVSINGVLKA